ncbi:hypothetical protein [Hymenobacter sp. DG01]|uniref:hypothetical protein n=1 Tax=Hymenobacter sp. DG01 TaxID=2584940 RepID=UPI00111D8A64|nr:hypothetical protein [Hymenobacter sp. DG01]
MKKKLFAALLSAGLVLGAVQTASANPFIGSESVPGECFAGVRPVYTTIYIFWLEVSHGVEYEACS